MYFLEISTHFCCFSAHIPYTSAYSSSCLFIQTKPEREMLISFFIKAGDFSCIQWSQLQSGAKAIKLSGSFKVYCLATQLERETPQLSMHRNSPSWSFILNTSGLQYWPLKFIVSHYTWLVQLAVQLLSYTNKWWCSSRFYWHSLDPCHQIQLRTVHPLLTELSYQLQPFAQGPANLC